MDPVPRFPVNYANFTNMAEVGDTIFIGRYLVRAFMCLAMSAHAVGQCAQYFLHVPLRRRRQKSNDQHGFACQRESSRSLYPGPLRMGTTVPAYCLVTCHQRL